jgi:chemotaxis protein CheD
MLETIDVQTGEVKVAREDAELVTKAIGSCIAIAAFNKEKKIGGLAHVMLPGRAPAEASSEMRYAENAMDELVRLMEEYGSTAKDIQLCIAGAANVLERPNETICELNVRSVIAAARGRGLMILARSLRGSKRRCVRFIVGTGSVYCTLGDDQEKLLWRWRVT